MVYPVSLLRLHHSRTLDTKSRAEQTRTETDASILPQHLTSTSNYSQPDSVPSLRLHCWLEIDQIIYNYGTQHQCFSCVANIHRSTFAVSRIDCARIPPGASHITHHTSPTKTATAPSHHPSLPSSLILHIRDRKERTHWYFSTVLSCPTH